eukprot:10835897-Lingulodinium_polyedra.AAC.1
MQHSGNFVVMSLLSAKLSPLLSVKPGTMVVNTASVSTARGPKATKERSTPSASNDAMRRKGWPSRSKAHGALAAVSRTENHGDFALTVAPC